MGEVTLQEMLICREERAAAQKELRLRFACPVISFTLNIPGPVKTSPLILRTFQTGLTLLEEALPPENILKKNVRLKFTGPEAFLAVSMAPESLKALGIRLEEASALGRLFDLDVIGPDGLKQTRPGQRGCMVCGKPGRACAAGRLHSVSQLQAACNGIMESHFRNADARAIAVLAVKSLVQEVDATPKPGLVDRRNTGSHRDMTRDTFLSSARALEGYFQTCVLIGQSHPADAFDRLRRAGLEAEKAMYAATGGVNTHKGAIYSLGILCGALGQLWSAEKTPLPLSALLDCCARLSRPAAQADFARMRGATPGERFYLEHGCQGARGEVSRGFPALVHTGLPVFKAGLDRGLDREQAGVCALIHLIARGEDSNLFSRGGPEGLQWAMQTARELVRRSPFPSRAALEALDDAFIARNLSPGGCADLLSALYFIDLLANDAFILLS